MYVYPVASHTCLLACLPARTPTCLSIRPPVFASVSLLSFTVPCRIPTLHLTIPAVSLLCTSQSPDASPFLTSQSPDTPLLCVSQSPDASLLCTSQSPDAYQLCTSQSPAASLLCTSQSPDASLQITSAQSDDYSDIPNSQIRRITAKRLLESKQTVPHYYLTIDCRVDKLVHLRQQLNAGLAKDGKKLSVNDFVIKASAQV